MDIFGILNRVVWKMLNDVSEKLTAFIIILMVEAVDSSETLDHIYLIVQCNMRDDSLLQNT